MHTNLILMLCNINKDVIMNLQLTSYRLKEIVLKPRISSLVFQQYLFDLNIFAIVNSAINNYIKHI